MQDKKIQQWEKWHSRGYGKFILLNMLGVCAFYAFSGGVAMTQLYMTMPESVKERGVFFVLLFKGIGIIAALIVFAFVFMHLTWKFKEKKYTDYTAANQMRGSGTEVAYSQLEEGSR